jgi:hypothetical protein
MVHVLTNLLHLFLYIFALHCMLLLQVVIAFCFIPASYAIVVVKEREVKAKHQQVLQALEQFVLLTTHTHTDL